MTREELVIWLRDAISEETQKPEDQIDYEFVNECMALLSELITDKYNLSEEEIKAQARRITSANPKNSIKKVELVDKRPIKLKRLAIFAIAAAVFICGALTVFAVSPAFRNMVMSVLGMDVGDSIEQNGVTYINSGEGKVYADIAELVEKEGLDIMYPHELPEGVEITKVTYFPDEDSLFINFVDTTISITIQFNVTDFDDYRNTEDVIVYNGIDFYVHERVRNNEIWYSIYVIDVRSNTLYSIKSQDRSLLVSLIKNIY